MEYFKFRNKLLPVFEVSYKALDISGTILQALLIDREPSPDLENPTENVLKVCEEDHWDSMKQWNAI